MSPILAALALALQPPPPPPENRPLPADFPPSRDLSPAHDTYFEEFGAATPEARAVLHRFSACVARRSTGLVAETLRRDFRSTGYRDALRRLARHNEGCFGLRIGALRSTGLPFAGSLAEHLIARDPVPLNVRLARAAAGAAIQPYSATDRMALCVVRSVPDDVTRLLSTEVGGNEETAALQNLDLPVRICNRGGPELELAPAAIRAIIATAAFRTVSGPGQSQGSN